jgi:DNA repair protein RAD50
VNVEEINNLKRQIQDLQYKIAEQEEQLRTWQPQYNTVLAELNNQERAKKTYSQNIELRAAKAELQELKASYQQKVSQSGHDESKYQDVQRQLQKLEQDSQTAATKRDKMQGKLENCQQQAVTLTAKLQSNLFVGIDEKHRRKHIEVETTELACKDLDNYYNALDTALQSFHTQKIKEINKIIRELWQLIYKGEDIDMIEVESGQEAAASAAATRATRSYNYRVVMRKGNVPLDMRGRCSAGQRVLASIVIRLALAETFCLNCGILALDEPTTNLDERNKAGLASALARIIHSRSRQQNFQLICITHDEEFLRLMNLELSTSIGFSKPEFYFRIRREEDGTRGRFFSKIDRVSWDELS